MTNEDFIHNYLRPLGTEYLLQHHVGGYGLIIRGSLCLDRQYSLRSLPENMRVNGSLRLMDCKSLRKLPNNLYVATAGQLILVDTFGITKLPDCLDATAIISTIELGMADAMQVKIVTRDKYNFMIIKDPTEEAKALHYALWEL